ncbi:MAG: hypothetical protein SGCHY_003313 [Lobulomycetales sp.]
MTVVAGPRIFSSLPLQILLYFDGILLVPYAIITLGMLAYKNIRLPYGPHVSGLEISAFLVLVILQINRLWLASRGNKCEKAIPLAFSLVLGLVCTVGALYFCLWQTYIYYLDWILNGLALSFLGLELVLGSVTLVVFIRQFR